jgi:hypothetical protein
MRRVAFRGRPANHARSAKSGVRHRRIVAGPRPSRPAFAYRNRGNRSCRGGASFSAPEVWHEPHGQGGPIRFVTEPAGAGYVHAATAEEVADRIAQLPRRFTRGLEVVQFSRMTRKRALFPCYGMQWGSTVYLYPIEESFEEAYLRPPTPQQRIDAEMYGGRWRKEGRYWMLQWTEDSVKDFFLNNVLIHEIGHIHDDRNTNPEDRERYANWFAIEYGLRASRGRQS